ncbi:MAG: hypothetical protein HY766_15060 [candidate division NC10 bacterium]|nr:hypothetical protein [candidate division NC10 bacterium]
MNRQSGSARARKAHASLVLREREALQGRLAALERASVLREQGQGGGDNTPTSDALDTVQEAMAKEEELLRTR